MHAYGGGAHRDVLESCAVEWSQVRGGGFVVIFCDECSVYQSTETVIHTSNITALAKCKYQAIGKSPNDALQKTREKARVLLSASVRKMEYL